MSDHHLSRWEKGAVFATGAGGAFNILLYQLGYTLADAVPGAGPIWWSRVFFAIVSFVGFDLALGVTVMAMRQGRRSRWAALTIVAVVVAAGGIGLDVAGVIALPVLHAAPVLVLAAFMLHLAAPRLSQRPEQLAQERDSLALDVAQLAQERDAAAHEAARAWDAARDHEETAGQLRHALTQAAAQVDHWQRMAAQAAQAPALTADHETVEVGTRRVTLRGLSRELEIDKNKLSRAVIRAGQGEG